MRRPPSALACIIVVLSVASAALAQEYDVRLHRAVKSGDRFTLTVNSTDKSTTTFTPSLPDEKNGSMTALTEFAGNVEVLAVDPKGRPAKETVKIARCVSTVDGARTQLFAAGDVVTAEVVDEDSVITMGGAPVAEEQRAALMSVLDMSSGCLTEDEIYPAGRPRKVGESWSVDRAALARSMAATGTKVAENAISGSVKIVSVADVAGVKCLMIEGSMKCANVKSSASGLTIDKGEIDMTFSGAYPVDVSLPIVESRLTTSLTMTARGKVDPDAKETLVETKAETTRFERIEPLK